MLSECYDDFLLIGGSGNIWRNAGLPMAALHASWVVVCFFLLITDY